jgi:hypothetical protein
MAEENLLSNEKVIIQDTIASLLLNAQIAWTECDRLSVPTDDLKAIKDIRRAGRAFEKTAFTLGQFAATTLNLNETLVIANWEPGAPF